MKRIVSKLLFAPLLALVALSVGTASPPATVSAQAVPDVFLSTAVPGVVVDRGKQVTFSIDVNNKSKDGRTVDLTLVSAPEGWQPVLKDRGFVVRSVYAPPEKLESVDLQIKAPADAKAQDYEFVLRASGNGVETTTLRLLVGVKDQPTAGTKLVSQYPELKGKAGAKFGFKAEIQNNSEEDRTYGLSAKVPDGWDISFKPSYEDKQISSAQVKSGATQSLDIEVTPPTRVQAGDYPVTLTAASQADKASADLKVTITGSYALAVTSRTDRFNTTATAGQDSPFNVIITNTGSATLQNVSLASTKPDGWNVTFKPDVIDSLEPGGQREVQATIKPSAKAIAGDYMLTFSATHPQASKDQEIRVSVETPTMLGWVGVGILVVVIGGLLGLFMKLGRR